MFSDIVIRSLSLLACFYIIASMVCVVDRLLCVAISLLGCSGWLLGCKWLLSLCHC